ncbi:CBS domain-containing protein [Planomonospora parontospora]|uniref:CBS domain-containing protein n=1 Tax=Planomonospora parontospora TaxID=58119 RepID=UPI001670CA0B|nr:CBS domain-containing protein [Planomonospora parontospora]GGL40874.1 histidine kinase [Planomonospora parontospora subsp. antibiotica]GII18202.1 histidine kinase [Planomonospora parontospora subsp. antibiotica]
MDVRHFTVAQVMSRTLVTVTPDESPLIAWEIMRRAVLHHLPVVEDGGGLRGVLSRAELAATWSGGPAEQSRVRVGDLLGGQRCPHVPPDARLADAAAAMLRAGIDAIPVVRAGTDTVPVLGQGGIVVGMVTATDVLRAVAGQITVEEGPSETMTGMFRLVPVLPHAPQA